MNEASNPHEGLTEWTAVWGSFQASRAEPPLACSVRCVVCLMIAFGGVPPSSHLSVVLQHRGSKRAREGGKKTSSKPCFIFRELGTISSGGKGGNDSVWIGLDQAHE